MTVKVTPEKAAKIKQKCKLLHGTANPSIRQVAKVIGTLVSACQGVKHGPLYFRQLKNEKIVALKNHKGNFDAKMTISEKGRADLAWWITHIDESDKPVALPAPDIILESDASLSGWGGYNTTKGVNCGGEWLPQDLLASAGINDLEMRAVFLTLKAFCSETTHIHVKILTDNISTVTYIREKGGSHSSPVVVLIYYIGDLALLRPTRFFD